MAQRRRRDRMAAGESGILCRSVAVDELAVWQSFHCLFDMGHRKHIAPGEKLPHMFQAVDVLLNHLLK